MKGLKFAVILAFLVIFTPSVLAVGENFGNFCDPATESTNSSDYIVYENFEGTGTPSGWTCSGAGCDFDDTSPVYAGSQSYGGSGDYAKHSTYTKTGVVTYDAFAYAPVNNDVYTVFYPFDDVHLGMRNDGYFRIYRDSSNSIVAAYNATTWYKAVMVVDWTNNNVSAYAYTTDGDLIGGGTSYSITADGGLYDALGVFSNKGNMDNVRIYEGAVCPTAPVPPPNSTNATERLQQNVHVDQNESVTVASGSYVPITSSSVTIPDTGGVYAIASIPITGGASSNIATCRITLDGAEFGNSEDSRTNTPGSSGNLVLGSEVETVTAGSHDIGVDCLRQGGSNFVVNNTQVTAHILVSPDGDNLTYQELNLSGSAGATFSNTITTSENATETGLARVLVADWNSKFDYSATGNITLTTEIAGTNCTTITRYGTSGSSGSASNACYVNSLINDTTYDIKVYTTGTGTIDGWLRVKELILHPSEINSTSLDGTSISGTATNSIVLGAAAGHSSPDLVVMAGVNPVSTSGTQTASFYVSDGTTNSSTVSRTTAEGQPGSILATETYNSFTNLTISLVSSCSSCELEGGDLVAYMSSDVAATPNSFIIDAENAYDGAAINEFSITLSDGRSFSTSDGSVEVSATGQLLNVTIVENSGAAVPYFANTTLNHNSTNDLTMKVNAYPIINATYGGSGVNNFTANGEATTNGKVYVRIYNETLVVNVTDAISNTGTNLSNSNASVTASPYLEYYTFSLLTANTFNFSIIDELTETLITENMTIELITGASAGTYTTTNGTLLLELLTPSDYTIRYYSTVNGNYTERDFIQTLTDRERYDISLYGLLVDEATDMIVTVKDTGGDPVETATVKLLRYYTSCNCYNTVEMAQTSASGEAYFIVDAYDGHYKFAVEYQGETEFLSTSPENFIPSNNLVERTITINLGSAYFESYRELTDIARTITYNNVTKGLSFTWNDPSGIVTKGCLYAEYLEGVHYTSVTPACQEASTGSVVLTLNNTARSYLYYAELETSTTYSEYIVFSGNIDKVISSLLDGNIGLGAFLASGVIIIMALLFSFSAIAVMVITAVGIIGMAALGVASLTTAFITGFITLIVGIAAYFMRS